MKYLEQHQPCPDSGCGSSDAYCVIQDSDGVHGFCFSCGKKFEMDEEQEEQTKSVSLPPLEKLDVVYRKLTPKTLEKFGVKRVENTNQIAYPYYAYKSSSPNRYKIRVGKNEKGKKVFKWTEGTSEIGLFGYQLFTKGGNKITVCTGENDALAIYQMNGDFPVVSFQNGDGSVKRLSTEDYEYLNSFDEIIACFDMDSSGREALDKFCNLFPIKVKVVELPTGYKDAHQMLEDGKVESFRKCWWNAGEYRPNNIVYPMDIKDEVLNPPKYDIIPYPWEGLNKQIFGLHTPEVVTVMAEPKVGKSFFTAFIAEHIWKTTQEKVGDISVENTPDERARTLLSLHMGKPLHLMLAGEKVDATKSEIEKAYDEFFGDRRIVLFEKDGISDPLEVNAKINYFVEAIGCRFIVFDHINYLSSYHDNDERKVLDKLSNMLVDLAKDKRINMMIVSHVNDEGKTFGSRNLIKASHTVLSLSRDRSSANEFIRNTTVLKVTESRRYGSRIGTPIYLRYNEDDYSWTEIDEEVYNGWKEDEDIIKE